MGAVHKHHRVREAEANMTQINDTRINQLYNINICPVYLVVLKRSGAGEITLKCKQDIKTAYRNTKRVWKHISASRMNHGVICCYARCSHS